MMERGYVLCLICVCSSFASCPNNWDGPDKGNEVSSSLYEELWNCNMDIAKETLYTKFLQQMQAGTLPASSYTTFSVQDVYYLIQVTDMLRDMSTREMPDNLKKFFQGRFSSYQKYTVAFLDSTSLTNLSVIAAHPAMVKYIHTYKEVMESNAPIYFAIALLPCSRLWPYLATNMNMTKSNPYYEFKRDNEGSDPAKHYKPLLDGMQDVINKTEAHRIYRNQMKNEKDFFTSSYI